MPIERRIFKGETAHGLNIKTEYGVEIIPHRDDPDRYTVIMTELDDNPGMSVTNAYEYLATAVWRDTLHRKATLPYLIRWIEHYEGREQWDEVDLKYDDAQDRFYAPTWRFIEREEVYRNAKKEIT